MKVLVIGSRRWPDRAKLYATLTKVHETVGIDLLIVGDAPGADLQARYWGRRIGDVPLSLHDADWTRLGKKAGPLRNIAMLDQEPDVVLAFRPRGVATPGTDHCVDEARRRGIRVVEVWTEQRPDPASSPAVTS